MQTVAQTTQPCKRVYYAHLDEASGRLARLDDGRMVFAGDDGSLTVIEPEHVPFLAVLGQVGLADAQRFLDTLAGGAARIACQRLQEVA